MTKLKEAAQSHQSKTTNNIADLEKVSVDLVLEKRVFKEGTPEEFEIDVVVVDNVDYRVPMIVLKDLKTILEKFPDLKEFSVMKTGEGLKGTRYSVIPLGV